MTDWVRCRWQDRVCLGKLDGDRIEIYDGSLFEWMGEGLPVEGNPGG